MQHLLCVRCDRCRRDADRDAGQSSRSTAATKPRSVALPVSSPWRNIVTGVPGGTSRCIRPPMPGRATIQGATVAKVSAKLSSSPSATTKVAVPVPSAPVWRTALLGRHRAPGSKPSAAKAAEFAPVRCEKSALNAHRSAVRAQPPIIAWSPTRTSGTNCTHLDMAAAARAHVDTPQPRCPRPALSVPADSWQCRRRLRHRLYWQPNPPRHCTGQYLHGLQAMLRPIDRFGGRAGFQVLNEFDRTFATAAGGVHPPDASGGDDRRPPAPAPWNLALWPSAL